MAATKVIINYITWGRHVTTLTPAAAAARTARAPVWQIDTLWHRKCENNTQWRRLVGHTRISTHTRCHRLIKLILKIHRVPLLAAIRPEFFSSQSVDVSPGGIDRRQVACQMAPTYNHWMRLYIHCITKLSRPVGLWIRKRLQTWANYLHVIVIQL